MTRFAAVAAVAVAFVGCGGDSRDQGEEAAEEAEAATPARVMIVQPADGAEVDTGPVLVVLEAVGVEIVAAGNMDRPSAPAASAGCPGPRTPGAWTRRHPADEEYQA